VIADKAYDADDRVVQPLKQAGIEAVIPPKSKRRTARNYNRELYKARHLIENFYCKLNILLRCPAGPRHRDALR
jgi:transposase